MQSKLYRSIRYKMIAGVCGGLAEYFNIDPVVVRVIFVLMLLFGGSGVLAYIILWIVMPTKDMIIDGEKKEILDKENNGNVIDGACKTSENGGEVAAKQSARCTEKEKNEKSIIGGIILIVVGGIFLVDNFLPNFDLGRFWPIILIAVGIILLWKVIHKGNE